MCRRDRTACRAAEDGIPGRAGDGRGCAALAEALETNSRVRELSLRGNNMGDLGARALEARLNEKGRLTKIDVSDNGIGEAGGRALGACAYEGHTRSCPPP